MEIVVKNGFLSFNKEKFRCAIGRNGLSSKKSEGDGCTPIGSFKILNLLYRIDKIGQIQTNIRKEEILENQGWCDDIESKFYNRKVRFPFTHSAEKLFRDDDLYDLVFVIDYNLNPIIKNKGRAIFLHVAKKDYSPTEGCVAIEKKQLINLAKIIHRDTYVRIID